jgi:hypothetical protein
MSLNWNCKAMTKPNYTVLLRRPDYVTTDDLDTYLTHIVATNPELAVQYARAEAVAADDEDVENAEDYAVLLVVEGHLNDLNPER